MPSGAVSDLTLDRFVGPEKLEQGGLAFAADRNTLTMSGDGQAVRLARSSSTPRAAPGDAGLGGR